MAKKKPSKKAAAAKKKPTKRTPAKKAARKPAAKAARKAAPKAAAKTARKAAGKKPARKAAPKAAAKPARKAAGKKPARKAAPKAAARPAPKAAPKVAAKPAPKAAPKAREPELREQSEQTVGQAIRSLRASAYASSDESSALARPIAEVVETTSAGTQPLAPEHAAVDDLTSSGNELLDIFQKYDRNRTGYIEAPGFARLLEALGQNITDEELQMAFDDIDTERSGKISWKQFKNWWTSR
jgi:hypothetical protein